MIAIGADHAGFKLKEHIKKFLEKKGYSYVDVGAYTDKIISDYPDYAKKVAQHVVKDKDKGIIICGTGIGSCIAANKIKKIRAALCHDTKTARLSREHNDANVLCLGQRTTKKEAALKIVTVWLKTRASKSIRHNRRIRKISALENA